VRLEKDKNLEIELDELIENIPNFPYKFRKLKYFDNEDIKVKIEKLLCHFAQPLSSHLCTFST